MNTSEEQKLIARWFPILKLPYLNWRKARVVAGMATMPSRAHSVELALASIINQVERLYLYLDRFDSVPNFARSSDKIVPILSSGYPGHYGAGKFIGLVAEPKLDYYYVSIDDDLIYSPNHASELISAIERYRALNRRVLVGVHGSVLHKPFTRYTSDRTVFNVAHSLDEDMQVDALGTGTSCFHASDFRFDPRSFPHANASDLQVAIEAQKKAFIELPFNDLRDS